MRSEEESGGTREMATLSSRLGYEIFGDVSREVEVRGVRGMRGWSKVVTGGLMGQGV